MTKEKVKDFLFKLFPDFSIVWESSDNYNKNRDGSFSYHSLFLEFTPYFWEGFKEFSDEQLKELFSTIESWEVEQTWSVEDSFNDNLNDTQRLSNAVFTCFLEDIAGRGFTERLKPFMGPKSLEYYSHYDL